METLLKTKRKQEESNSKQESREGAFHTAFFLCEFETKLRIRLLQNLMTMIVLFHVKVLQMLLTRKRHKFYQNCVSSRRRSVKETNDFQAPVKELRTYFIKI